MRYMFVITVYSMIVCGNILVDYNGSGSRVFSRLLFLNMTFRMTAVALDQMPHIRIRTLRIMHLPGDGEAFMKHSPYLNIIDFDGISVNVVIKTRAISFEPMEAEIICFPKGIISTFMWMIIFQPIFTMGLAEVHTYRNGRT